MTSSPAQSFANPDAASTAKRERRFAVARQLELREMCESATPGSLNDAKLVREILAEAIRKCGKSRAQLADDMSELTGSEVTVRRLNAFTAKSREDWPFPLELARAFCVATGDFTLLFSPIELSGFRVISAEEGDVLDLGRQFLKRKAADERMSLLEAKLHRRSR